MTLTRTSRSGALGAAVFAMVSAGFAAVAPGQTERAEEPRVERELLEPRAETRRQSDPRRMDRRQPGRQGARRREPLPVYPGRRYFGDRRRAEYWGRYRGWWGDAYSPYRWRYGQRPYRDGRSYAPYRYPYWYRTPGAFPRAGVAEAPYPLDQFR